MDGHLARQTMLYVALLLLLATSTVCTARTTPGASATGTPGASSNSSIVRPTLSGYLPITTNDSLYFAYFEQTERGGQDAVDGPIILWLQGGPGCASTFGMLYELGPWSVVEEDLSIRPNPGAWNRRAGLLIIDQPLGTGFSFASDPAAIPKDELGMAEHLYAALQAFYTRFAYLQDRPLIVTGESYAGKYVPSLGHFILQAARSGSDRNAGSTAGLSQMRDLPQTVTPPVFKLAGVAIGNGFTSPRAQTLTLADTAWWSGLISNATRAEIKARTGKVVDLIDAGSWAQAKKARDDLRSFILKVTGLATMFDIRRTQDYDPTEAVDRYLNLPKVRDALRANPKGRYWSCSGTVGTAMVEDVMQSVTHLVPDILAHIHVLLYQGQFDILDGPASNTAWIEQLEGWPDLDELTSSGGALWYALPPGANTTGATPAGWWRTAGLLTHAVVFRAGHMVPHDQPEAMLHLLETWTLRAMGYNKTFVH